MKVSNFVKWSVNHVLHISEGSSDEEEWNLFERSGGFPWDQIQETEVLNCPEEEDEGDVEEESASVSVTSESNEVDEEGCPELDTQSPGWLNERN